MIRPWPKPELEDTTNATCRTWALAESLLRPNVDIYLLRLFRALSGCCGTPEFLSVESLISPSPEIARQRQPGVSLPSN